MTPRRPSAWWYAVPAALAATAVAVAAFAVVGAFVALAGYDIESVPPTSEVVLADRPVAVWTQAAAATSCTATEESGRSSWRSVGGTMTYSRGARTWERVGHVVGPPGSRHQLVCTLPVTSAPVVGLADAPRVAERTRDVGIGLAIAGALSALAVTSLLVVVVKRRRVRPPSTGSVGQSSS